MIRKRLDKYGLFGSVSRRNHLLFQKNSTTQVCKIASEQITKPLEIFPLETLELTKGVLSFYCDCKS